MIAALVRAIVLLLLWTLASATSRRLSTTLVEFETIERGYFSGVKESVADVFTSATCFCRFWAEHASDEDDCPATDVDFGRGETIVVLFRGTMPSGGHEIVVTAMEEEESADGYVAWTVRYDEIDPPPGVVTTQALTRPHHVVRATSSSTVGVACFARNDDDGRVVARDRRSAAEDDVVVRRRDDDGRRRREGRVRRRRPPPRRRRRRLESEPVCRPPRPLTPPSPPTTTDDRVRPRGVGRTRAEDRRRFDAASSSSSSIAAEENGVRRGDDERERGVCVDLRR